MDQSKQFWIPERKVFSSVRGLICGNAITVRRFFLNVFEALGVDDRIGEALSALSSNLFEFPGVPINQLCPLAHLVARLLVEFSLVEVVLPLQLLRQSPDDVVLELKEFALFFVVLH